MVSGEIESDQSIKNLGQPQNSAADETLLNLRLSAAESESSYVSCGVCSSRQTTTVDEKFVKAINVKFK